MSVELLVSAEAAQVLGITDSRVRQLQRSGQLPAALTLPDGRHLFHRAEVERVRADRESARAKRREAAVA